jgi:hypothetical protein
VLCAKSALPTQRAGAEWSCEGRRGYVQQFGARSAAKEAWTGGEGKGEPSRAAGKVGATRWWWRWWWEPWPMVGWRG